MDTLDLLPAGLSATSAILLVAFSFLGSLTTAAAGIGGGVILLALMANTMPTAAIIPVHGVVMLGSNVGRSALMRAHIDWSVVLVFGLGSVVGVAVGGSVAVALPPDLLRLALAAFILYSVWLPPPRFAGQGQLTVLGVGAVASFLTMFIGATGAFISAVLRHRGYEPKPLVATHAICMSGQHGLKIIAFGILGFEFSNWYGLIGLMLASGFAGTYVGGKLLHRIPAHVFNLTLKLLLTALALSLLVAVYRG